MDDTLNFVLYPCVLLCSYDLFLKCLIVLNMITFSECFIYLNKQTATLTLHFYYLTILARTFYFCTLRLETR